VVVRPWRRGKCACGERGEGGEGGHGVLKRITMVAVKGLTEGKVQLGAVCGGKQDSQTPTRISKNGTGERKQQRRGKRRNVKNNAHEDGMRSEKKRGQEEQGNVRGKRQCKQSDATTKNCEGQSRLQEGEKAQDRQKKKPKVIGGTRQSGTAMRRGGELGD